MDTTENGRGIPMAMVEVMANARPMYLVSSKHCFQVVTTLLVVPYLPTNLSSIISVHSWSHLLHPTGRISNAKGGAARRLSAGSEDGREGLKFALYQ